jgi:hypothetical protein
VGGDSGGNLLNVPSTHNHTDSHSNFKARKDLVHSRNRQWRHTWLRHIEAAAFSRKSVQRWRRGWSALRAGQPADRPLPTGRFLVLISVSS